MPDYFARVIVLAGVLGMMSMWILLVVSEARSRKRHRETEDGQHHHVRVVESFYDQGDG